MTPKRYWSELGSEGRTVFATALGTAFSIALNLSIGSFFLAEMTREFGWSRQAAALSGTLGLLALFSFPLAGRLADRFGTRRVAIVGIVATPGCYLAYSMMSGAIAQYFAIYAVLILLGAMGSGVVWGRLIAQRLVHSRGLALALQYTGPALIGGLATLPFMLPALIEAAGWRSAIRVVAASMFVFGLIALALLPADPVEKTGSVARPAGPTARAAYGRAFGARAFWLLVSGFLLCNIGNALTAQQLAPMLLDRGLTLAEAGGYASLLAASTIIGRFASGLALDRLSTPLVSAIGMGLPAFGFALIAWQAESAPALAGAIMMLGLSAGAESDVGGFVAARYLGSDIFGTVFGIVVGMVAGGSAIGALILSRILATTDSFAPFLLLAASATTVGALLFLALATCRPVASAPTEDIT